MEDHQFANGGLLLTLQYYGAEQLESKLISKSPETNIVPRENHPANEHQRRAEEEPA